MAIQFECPHCKAGYEVTDDLGGKMIMCRLCQKRGPVRSGTSPTVPAAGTPSDPSRRKFNKTMAWVVASVGSITLGAILARTEPWRYWRSSRKPSGNSTRRRGRRGGDTSPRPGGGPRP